ncbi:MAG TPA: branched-chain amino acid ABC transporter permease [Burkholderiales bacterium]|nr:branched-chain amino acid ABC transporter permease [Burkholderiales bacterium]
MRLNANAVSSLVLFALLLLAPLAREAVYPVFLMKLMCFALFACAFNLLLGYTGLLSFGHAAFLGSAGYVTGYAIKGWGLPLEVGLLAGTATAAALGYLFGSLAIRRSGIYFAMITLALAQMVFFLAVQMPFTGGEDGLQGIPRGRLLGIVDLKNDISLYYVVLAIFAFGFWLVYRTIHSPFGQVLKAIRENEPRAVSLGYDVERYKLAAFVISAGLAGLAGATKSVVLQLASLTDVHWHMSGSVVLMTLLGGMGTVLGPVVGAATVIGLENKLGDIGNWLAQASGVEFFSKIGESVTVVTGLIFVICVLLFRRGIVGELQALWKRMF